MITVLESIKQNWKGIGILVLAIVVFGTLAILSGGQPPVEQAWYEVEDWEVEVCSKYGGKQRTESTATSSEIFHGGATVTLQARKTRTPDNDTLYEIGYFVGHPIEGMTYTIKVKNSVTGIEEILDKDFPSPPGGFADFKAFFSNLTYDRAELKHAVQGRQGTLVVPIVEVSQS